MTCFRKSLAQSGVYGRFLWIYIDRADEWVTCFENYIRLSMLQNCIHNQEACLGGRKGFFLSYEIHWFSPNVQWDSPENLQHTCWSASLEERNLATRCRGLSYYIHSRWPVFRDWVWHYISSINTTLLHGFGLPLTQKALHASCRGPGTPVSCMLEGLTGCPRALGWDSHNSEAFLFQTFLFVLTMLW